MSFKKSLSKNSLLYFLIGFLPLRLSFKSVYLKLILLMLPVFSYGHPVIQNNCSIKIIFNFRVYVTFIFKKYLFKRRRKFLNQQEGMLGRNSLTSNLWVYFYPKLYSSHKWTIVFTVGVNNNLPWLLHVSQCSMSLSCNIFIGVSMSQIKIECSFAFWHDLIIWENVTF